MSADWLNRADQLTDVVVVDAQQSTVPFVTTGRTATILWTSVVLATTGAVADYIHVGGHRFSPGDTYLFVGLALLGLGALKVVHDGLTRTPTSSPL